jgi:hypothetical protein
MKTQALLPPTGRLPAPVTVTRMPSDPRRANPDPDDFSLAALSSAKILSRNRTNW